MTTRKAQINKKYQYFKCSSFHFYFDKANVLVIF